MGTWIEPYIKSVYDPKPFLDFIRENIPSEQGPPGPQGPAGPSGASSYTFITNEVPSGPINGSNVTFTTALNFVPGTLECYYNGQKLTYGEDYITIGLFTIQLNFSPEVGDIVTVDYITDATFTNLVLNEVPTGLINNVNTLFTTDNPFVMGSLEVWLNGVKQTQGVDYTFGSNTFVMMIAPLVGDIITVNYDK